MESVEGNEILQKRQEDQKFGRYSRESIYNIKDQMESNSLPFNEDYICGLGIAQMNEEQIKSFLKRHGDAAVVNKAQSAESEKENSENDIEEKLIVDKVKYIFSHLHDNLKLAVEFEQLNVPQSPHVNQIVDVILGQAIRSPKYCRLYATICVNTVVKEYHTSTDFSKFHFALITRVQAFFSLKAIVEKMRDMNAEADQEKREGKMASLLKAIGDARSAKFGTALFVGHLFAVNFFLVPNRIMLCIVQDLLKSVNVPLNDRRNCDEDSIASAIELVTVIGRTMLFLEHIAAGNEFVPEHQTERYHYCVNRLRRTGSHQTLVPFDRVFATIESARPYASKRLRRKISDLVAVRDGGWATAATFFEWKK